MTSWQILGLSVAFVGSIYMWWDYQDYLRRRRGDD